MNSVVKLKRKFLDHLKTDRESSEKTIENYNRYLSRFFDFSKIKKPTDITPERIHAFQRYLSTQKGAKKSGHIELMKPRTLNFYLTALRQFLRYAQWYGVLVPAPQSVILTKTESQPAYTLDEDDWERLRNALNTTTLEGLRDRAILEIIKDAHLRVSEMCALSITDVDFKNNSVTIRSDDKEVRTILIFPSASKLLKKYLKKRTDAHPFLFVRYGRKMHDGTSPKLSPRAIQRLVQKYRMQAGIKELVTPDTPRK